MELPPLRSYPRLPDFRGFGSVPEASGEDLHLHGDPEGIGEVHVVRVLPLPRLLSLRLYLPADQVPPGRVRPLVASAHHLAQVSCDQVKAAKIRSVPKPSDFGA